MGIWTEIKHALNSTLGTEKFKPLDKIIEGQKLFVTGGPVIANLIIDPIECAVYAQGIAKQPTFLGKFSTKISGTITANLYIVNGSYATDSIFYSVKNKKGEEVAKNNIITTNDYKPTVVSLQVPLDAGEEYSFYAHMETAGGISTRNLSATSLKISAQIIDSHYFDVETVNGKG